MLAFLKTEILKATAILIIALSVLVPRAQKEKSSLPTTPHVKARSVTAR